MLKNLLKYDLHYIYRVLIFFYIITPLCAVLTRLCFELDDSAFMSFLGLILQGTTISLIISMLVNNFMRCWARFTKNFYGDESYLTHTLPIKISKLFTAKYVATLISLLTTILVALLALLIMYYSVENFQILESAFLATFNNYDGFSIWEAIPAIILVFYLELLCAVSVGYVGLILGHRRNSRRMLWSIIFGLICYALTQAVVLASIFVLGLFESNVRAIFTNNFVPVEETIRLLIYTAIGVYTAWCAIYYTTGVLLLKRGVNID